MEVEGGSLTAIAGFDGHQGIALDLRFGRRLGLDWSSGLAWERHRDLRVGDEPAFGVYEGVLAFPRHDVRRVRLGAGAAGQARPRCFKCGVWAVSGRSRVPMPPASRMAFMSAANCTRLPSPAARRLG